MQENSNKKYGYCHKLLFLYNDIPLLIVYHIKFIALLSGIILIALLYNSRSPVLTIYTIITTQLINNTKYSVLLLLNPEHADYTNICDTAVEQYYVSLPVHQSSHDYPHHEKI